MRHTNFISITTPKFLIPSKTEGLAACRALFYEKVCYNSNVVCMNVIWLSLFVEVDTFIAHSG